MGNDLYWISALTYAVVLAIVLINDIRIKKKVNGVELAFREMTIWVVCFCLQDALWGVCERGIIGNDTVFFVSSSIFHISTVLTTFFWLNYVLIYLKEPVRRKNVFLILDGLVILFELILVIINFFTPTLFRIVDGAYVTGPLRPLTFVNQYVIYLAIGVITLVFLVRNKDGLRRRYRAVFFFALAPILLGIFQLLYPDAPFYSLGYFLGCFIVHIFVVAKDREKAMQGSVMKCIADTYHTMHLIDLENNSYEEFIRSELVTSIAVKEKHAQGLMNAVFAETVSDEYRDAILEFSDLRTLSDRMKDKSIISCEFVGRNLGWVRASFISVEKVDEEQKKVMLVTQIIDAEKRAEIDLLFKSNNDELTGLFNRRAYEDDVSEYRDKEVPDNLVFVSLDVNGLKATNDTLGHAAGDELIRGAADCMRRCFGPYGKIYRTGGDEFNAIIFATPEQLQIIRKDFEEVMLSWSGQGVKHLAVSSGYVCKSDVSTPSLAKMSILADKRMYENKAEFYRLKGVDRRGQYEAHTALSMLYSKILKINVTEDTYQIINMVYDDTARENPLPSSISDWFHKFGNSIEIHSEDSEDFLKKTELAYLQEYFRSDMLSLSIFYRRLYGDEYKHVMMEIIPANDYTHERQTLFLYVKKIDR